MAFAKDNYILSIDTSTRSCSVALTFGGLSDGNVVASLLLNNSVTHSRRLLSAIDSLLKTTETDWKEIAGIAIGLGPGSFTGLRIGMATAKGLAIAAKLPLLGIASLDGVASSCATGKLVCSVLDARKKEVYAAFYRQGAEGKMHRQKDIVAISPALLAEQIVEPTLFIGDAVPLYRDVWSDKIGENAFFAPAHLNITNAANLGLLADELLKSNTYLNIGEASPLYVRASDAELSLGIKI